MIFPGYEPDQTEKLSPFSKFKFSKESQKCEKRRQFNKKAKCRKGYFKCASDHHSELRESTYQDALQNCELFGYINHTGKIQNENSNSRFYSLIQVIKNVILNAA